MDGWIDGWMERGAMGRWMEGGRDGWREGEGGRVREGGRHGWMDGWMGGWVDGWMGGWMNGQAEPLAGALLITSQRSQAVCP